MHKPSLLAGINTQAVSFYVKWLRMHSPITHVFLYLISTFTEESSL